MESGSESAAGSESSDPFADWVPVPAGTPPVVPPSVDTSFSSISDISGLIDTSYEDDEGEDEELMALHLPMEVDETDEEAQRQVFVDMEGDGVALRHRLNDEVTKMAITGTYHLGFMMTNWPYGYIETRYGNLQPNFPKVMYMPAYFARENNLYMHPDDVANSAMFVYHPRVRDMLTSDHTDEFGTFTARGSRKHAQVVFEAWDHYVREQADKFLDVYSTFATIATIDQLPPDSPHRNDVYRENAVNNAYRDILYTHYFDIVALYYNLNGNGVQEMIQSVSDLRDRLKSTPNGLAEAMIADDKAMVRDTKPQDVDYKEVKGELVTVDISSVATLKIAEIVDMMFQHLSIQDRQSLRMASPHIRSVSSRMPILPQGDATTMGMAYMLYQHDIDAHRFCMHPTHTEAFVDEIRRFSQRRIQGSFGHQFHAMVAELLGTVQDIELFIALLPPALTADLVVGPPANFRLEDGQYNSYEGLRSRQLAAMERYMKHKNRVKTWTEARAWLTMMSSNLDRDDRLKSDLSTIELDDTYQDEDTGMHVWDPYGFGKHGLKAHEASRTVGVTQVHPYLNVSVMRPDYHWVLKALGTVLTNTNEFRSSEQSYHLYRQLSYLYVMARKHLWVYMYDKADPAEKQAMSRYYSNNSNAGYTPQDVKRWLCTTNVDSLHSGNEFFSVHLRALPETDTFHYDHYHSSADGAILLAHFQLLRGPSTPTLYLRLVHQHENDNQTMMFLKNRLVFKAKTDNTVLQRWFGIDPAMAMSTIAARDDAEECFIGAMHSCDLDTYAAIVSEYIVKRLAVYRQHMRVLNMLVPGRVIVAVDGATIYHNRVNIVEGHPSLYHAVRLAPTLIESKCGNAKRTAMYEAFKYAVEFYDYEIIGAITEANRNGWSAFMWLLHRNVDLNVPFTHIRGPTRLAQPTAVLTEPYTTDLARLRTVLHANAFGHSVSYSYKEGHIRSINNGANSPVGYQWWFWYALNGCDSTKVYWEPEAQRPAGHPNNFKWYVPVMRYYSNADTEGDKVAVITQNVITFLKKRAKVTKDISFQGKAPLGSINGLVQRVYTDVIALSTEMIVPDKVVSEDEGPANLEWVNLVSTYHLGELFKTEEYANLRWPSVKEYAEYINGRGDTSTEATEEAYVAAGLKPMPYVSWFSLIIDTGNAVAAQFMVESAQYRPVETIVQDQQVGQPPASPLVQIATRQLVISMFCEANHDTAWSPNARCVLGRVYSKRNWELLKYLFTLHDKFLKGDLDGFDMIPMGTRCINLGLPTDHPKFTEGAPRTLVRRMISQGMFSKHDDFRFSQSNMDIPDMLKQFDNREYSVKS